MLVIVELILSRFSASAYDEAAHDIYRQINDNTAKKASELSLVMNEMLTTGLVAADYMTEEEETVFDKRHIDIITNSNRNLYATALVDPDGKGISTLNDEEIDISGSDYFKAAERYYYSFTNNDCLEGKVALVCVVPVKWQGELAAYLIQYIDIEMLKKFIPIEDESRDNAVLITDFDGNRKYSEGKPWVVVQSNLYSTLADTVLENTTTDEIDNNIKTSTAQWFIAQKGAKSCFFATSPVGDTGWTLINIVDMSSYVDKKIRARSQYEQSTAKSIMLIVFGACALLVFFVVSYRVKDIRTNKDLENKADTDLLTGLNNKMTAERKIDEWLLREPDSPHVLFLFDIDNFKKINDTMGHAFGDQVLKTLGEQLSQEFRKSDILGRIGGDEFVILLKDLKSEDIILKEADKLMDFFQQFKVGDYVKYSATASVGAAIYPKDGKTFQELYRSADNALYEAKKQGKNRLIFYHSDLHDNVEKREKEAHKNPGARE